MEHLKEFKKENEELHKEMKRMNEKLDQISETGKEVDIHTKQEGILEKKKR
ncbi:hypothetical protein [Peribacillus butanolivorans]|uniref:hypothetical protein n=1 Tax=Peribacillus butanolivorans TaxID=421767 RepID=UPI0035DA5F2A